MKKFYLFLLTLLASVVTVMAFQPEEQEEQTAGVAATIISGNDTITLNSHSAVSAEMVNSIEVSFDGIVPQTVSYELNTLKLVEGGEGYSWEKDATLSEGEISVSGKGLVELVEPITFEKGTKYALVVKYATPVDSYEESFEINGAYIEDNFSVSLLGEGEKEYTLNSHSIVTIDEAIEGIKVTGLDQEMGEVSFAIFDKKATLAEGKLSVSAIGYAEFAPVTLVEGNQYDVVIYNGEETIYDYIVIGAAQAPAYEIAATIYSGADTIALSNHSTVSAEMINSFDVTFDGILPTKAGYSINTMAYVEGEDGYSWEIAETLAQGEVSLSGKGYVELEEPITLEAGTKYTLIINAATPVQNYEETFEINGAYVEENLVVSLLGDEEKEYTLNGHSVITVDEAISGIKVTGLDRVMGEVSFAILDKKATIASGVLSVNTIGIAEFPSVYLYEGHDYDVVVYTGEETLFDQVVIGAAEEPSYEIGATIISGTDEVELNTHSAVSAEMINSIDLTFNGYVPMQAGYSINKMVYVEGEDGYTWEIDETLAQGEVALSGKGHVELDEPITLEAGSKYALIINSSNPLVQYAETFYINGAYAESNFQVALVATDGSLFTLNTHSIVTIDEYIEGIKVAGLDQTMGEVTYAILGKKEVLASGTLSVNTIGYAEFAPVTLVEGEQYDIVISAGEETLIDIIVIGACEPTTHEVYATIFSGEEEIALNNHSAVSAEMVNTLEVAFDGIQPQQAGFSINKMTLVEGEDGYTWEIEQTLVQDALGLNGKASVELEEPITFEAATKYAVIVNYRAGGKDYSETFYINGSYTEPTLAVSLIGETEEYALNTHSIVTIDEPVSAIKVSGLDQTLEEVSYAILDKKATLASGVMSVNAIGFAEFSPLTLVEGVQYDVVVYAGTETIFDQIVIGAAEEPESEIATTIYSGNDSIALNTHSAVSAEMINSIDVTFDGVVPTKAGYSVSTLKLVEEEGSYSWEYDQTLSQGELSLSGKGFVEFETPITLEAGTKYAVTINYAAGSENKEEVYYINGAYVEPNLAVTLISDEDEYTLNTHSIITIEKAINGIKVAGLDQEMGEVSYAIFAKKNTLVSGTLSVSTIGYAEFPAVTLYEGVQYDVVVFAGENTIFDQIVIGAAEPAEYEIAATLNGEISINTHSEVAVGSIKNIEVTFDGVVPMAAGYSINSLKQTASTEASTWEVDETLAQGSLSLSGKGYAELEDWMILEAGKKFNIIITYQTPDGENNSVEFVINGSCEDPQAINAIDAEIAADGKYLDGNKIVIVKAGVKYNVAGQIIK